MFLLHSAPFNMLTRKHHCRLCGRVVCFLPPNARNTGRSANQDGNEADPRHLLPKRLVRCSTFVMYDRHSAAVDRSTAAHGLNVDDVANTPCLTLGTIREVDLGDNLSGHDKNDPSAMDPRVLAARAAEIKAGVRICRECLNTISRKQKRAQPSVTEPWVRLYKVSESYLVFCGLC